MKHEWSGGQYNVYRFLLGIVLLLNFTGVIALPESDSVMELTFAAILKKELVHPVYILSGCLLSGLLALGRYDRLAALLLYFAMPDIDTPIFTPLSPYHYLLILHIFSHDAPFGSSTAPGSLDPDNGWQLPSIVPRMSWLIIAGSAFSGGFRSLFKGELLQILAQGNDIAKAVLAWPEGLLKGCGLAVTIFLLAFGPLALKARFRPVLLILSFVFYLGLVILGVAGPEFLLIHFVAWNPAWLAPQFSETPETLYYDGSCGLCHRAVRFVLAEDRDGRLFQFAPLHGDHFNENVPAEVQERLPDSILLKTRDNQFPTRTSAVITLLCRLGGLWRILGWCLKLVPRFLRDGVYNLIASIRNRIFKKPADACPILPENLRKRFIY